MALVLLLGALTVVPPRQRLFTVFMLLGRLSPEDVALEVEVAAIEKVAEDWREGVFSTLVCWQNKKARTHGSGSKAREAREPSRAFGPIVLRFCPEGLWTQHLHYYTLAPLPLTLLG